MFGTLRIGIGGCVALAVPLTASAAPTGSDWGTNLWFHSDWTGDGAFIDATRTFAPFVTSDEQEIAYGDPRLTDQGIPLVGNVKARSFMRGYEAGAYTLIYGGTGTISAGGLGTIDPASLFTVGDLTYATVHVQAPTGSSKLELKVESVDPTDPIRDLRLIAPGYDANTDRVYRDEFLRRLQPFTTIRFMDWTHTNGSSISSWDQHRSADYLIQTSMDGAPNGVAWSHIAALSREADRNAWVNIPHLADADYVEQFAGFWKENLQDGHELYVEFSNEIWNAAFSQYDDLNPVEGQLYHDVVAPKLVEIDAVLDRVFGEDRDRVNLVLSGQAANEWHVRRAIEHFEESGLNADEVIDAVAIAPYFNIDKYASMETLDELMAALVDMSEERSRTRAHAELADRAGVPLVAYEGGFGGSLQRTIDDSLRDLAHEDPRLAEAYAAYQQMWTEEGGDVMMNYALTSYDSVWGLLNAINDEGSVKWDAVLRLLLDGGDIDLDGEVGFLDFTAFRDAFGDTETWWEGGDFNGDRTVDASDWQILSANLDRETLTDAQRAEVSVFENGMHAPEPAMLTLLAAGGLCLLGRPRRAG